MQLSLPTSHIAIGIEHIANETTDGIHSDPIYGQINKNSSLKSVPTSGDAFDASYGVPTHPSNAGGSVDTPTGSEEALLNRSSVLFVAVSFILLMVISLAWLVFYYVQRFRYLHSKERVSRRLAELARKAVARIPVKTLHSGDKETNSDLIQCAICIEPFRPLDNVRILPCRHYFHKLCIDPWLLEKRSCPMCKLDILQAYCLRTELSTYPPTHSDSASGAGLTEETARGSASNPLLRSPEEDGLEHVSLLVHHSSDEPAADTVVEVTSSGAEPLTLRQTAPSAADWWSVELAEAGQPVASLWPGLEQAEATVSLLDQHLAPTGLLLAAPPLISGNNDRQQQYCYRSLPATSTASACASTSVTFADGTVVSAVRPEQEEDVEARHSADELQQTSQCLPDFYHIDGQKTEKVIVTTACSVSPATTTGSNKKQASRRDRKSGQYSLANRLSSLLTQRLQSPWSSSGGPRRQSPAGDPSQKLKGLGSTTLPPHPYSQAFLPSAPPSALVSFRSLRIGEPPVAASACATIGPLAHRPVGSERIVVAVVEPAPPCNTTASVGSPEQADVADRLSSRPSRSSLVAVEGTQSGGTGKASGRASSDVPPDNQQ